MSVLKPAFLAGCPNIRRNLEMLAKSLGAKKPTVHKCPAADLEPIDHAAEMRELLNGSTIAIIGIGGNDGQRHDSFHALRRAANTRKAAMVITADAWDPLTKWLDQLPAHDRKFMSRRVISGILVGRGATDEMFPGFLAIFPEAATYSIVCLGWADASCISIAGHIAKTSLAKQVV